jgi:hypothetical protein
MTDEQTIGSDTDLDVEGHRLAGNDTETTLGSADLRRAMPDDRDTEGHRLATNDDETVAADDDPETALQGPAARR